MNRVRLRRTSWPGALVLTAAYALPVFVYLNRFLIPDYSYDTLNYHLFNGWRGATHFLPFGPFEFFPAAAANVPPFFDSLFVLTRLLLGYRLGTSLGLLAYLAAVLLLTKITRRLCPAANQRLNLFHALVILYAATNLELLFQLATYFVDILNTTVLLASFYCLLLLNDALEHDKPWRRWLIVMSALCGISVLGKTTSLVFVGPELAVAAWIILRAIRRRDGLRRVGWLALAFALTFGPVMTIWGANSVLTGNPVFPLFNGIFHSPYTSAMTVSDTNVGGTNLLSRLLWPVYSAAHPARLAEPHSLFTDYKLTGTWLAAISLLAISRLTGRGMTRALNIALFSYLGGVLLWAAVFGVARYASFALMLGPLLFIPVMDYAKAALRWRAFQLGAAWLVGAVLLVQVVRVAAFDFQYDMSWRPNLIHDQAMYLNEARLLFDNTEELPLSKDGVASIQIVVDCAAPTSGYAVVSALRDKPMVSLVENPVYLPITTNREYRKAVLRSLQRVYPGRRTFQFAAFATSNGLDNSEAPCEQALKDNGAKILSQSVLPDFVGYRFQGVELTVGAITL